MGRGSRCVLGRAPWTLTQTSGSRVLACYVPGRRTKLYETLQGLAKPYIEVEELLAGGKQEEEDAASTSTKTHKGIPPSTLMVDFDEVAWACLAVWHEQMEADKVGVERWRQYSPHCRAGSAPIL